MSQLPKRTPAENVSTAHRTPSEDVPTAQADTRRRCPNCDILSRCSALVFDPRCPSCYCPVVDGYVLVDRLNICFKASTSKKSFDDARDICSQIGARLIVLDTDDKNAAVSRYVNASRGEANYYIGLTDMVTENKFVWGDGHTVGFTKWEDGEPNDFHDQDCVLLTPWTTRWRNAPCWDRYKYVCEKHPW
ncbi:C-type lectin-like [Gigantopelta aegis]|uniref:C-type lectin-like n=1 Tax=Gigantopelta aegis TaxID=1735272 RepID=UPI001B889130|nr:C-type lectin-like [Gigantopelta aegis]